MQTLAGERLELAVQAAAEWAMLTEAERVLDEQEYLLTQQAS